MVGFLQASVKAMEKNDKLSHYQEYENEIGFMASIVGEKNYRS